MGRWRRGGERHRDGDGEVGCGKGETGWGSNFGWLMFSVMYEHTLSKLADHRWIEEKGDMNHCLYLPVQCQVPQLVCK